MGTPENWLNSPTRQQMLGAAREQGPVRPDAAPGKMRRAKTKPADIGVRAAAVMPRAWLEWLTARAKLSSVTRPATCSRACLLGEWATGRRPT